LAASETYPDDLRYHAEHDWARVEGDEAVLGITWFAQDALGELDSAELLDLAHIARVLGLPGGGDTLDSAAGPRGYRLLSKVPRLPAAIVDRLVGHFGGLQKLLAAGIDDLMAVDGVGEQRARAVREGLSRLAESSILERYV